MKIHNILISAVLLTSTAFSADYTWKTDNATTTSIVNQSSWDGAGSSGTIAALNKEGNRFIIGDGTTINIGNQTVDMANSDLVVRNNVTMGYNWAFNWKNVTIGSNYRWTGSGTGIRFYNRFSTEGTVNYNVNWAGTNNATGLAFGGGVIDLGTTGLWAKAGNAGFSTSSKVTFTGKLALRNTTLTNGYVIASRTIVQGGVDLWNRETQIYSFTDEFGNSLNNLNAQGTAADWAAAAWAGSTDQDILKQHVGEVYYTFDEGGTRGIKAYYVTYNPDLVPEPATATLGLFGLSALMLRRRRK